MELQHMLRHRADIVKHYPDRGPQFTIVASIMCTIASIMVAFRVIQTYLRRKTVGLEDTMAVAAMVC